MDTLTQGMAAVAPIDTADGGRSREWTEAVLAEAAEVPPDGNG